MESRRGRSRANGSTDPLSEPFVVRAARHWPDKHIPAHRRCARIDPVPQLDVPVRERQRAAHVGARRRPVDPFHPLHSEGELAVIDAIRVLFEQHGKFLRGRRDDVIEPAISPPRFSADVPVIVVEARPVNR